jgi:hypothetical protein
MLEDFDGFLDDFVGGVVALDKVIVDAQGLGELLVHVNFGLAQVGEENDGDLAQVGLLFDLFENVEAVEFGHENIEENELGLEFFEDGEALFAVGGDPDFVALEFEFCLVHFN